MSGRGSRREAARLLCAVAAAALAASPAWSQTAPPPADPAELDPNAPLDTLPNIGVDWPELNTPDVTPPAPSLANPKPQAAASEAAAATGQIRYSWDVEGLAPTGDSEDLLAAFRHQSALEADRKK